LTPDDAIRAFFGGNAVVAVVVLALITYFLVREGAGFFGQNRRNLEVYRLAGLEFVDHLRAQEEAHTALTRRLSELRLKAFARLSAGTDGAEAAERALAEFDAYAERFGAAIDPLRALGSELAEVATGIKTKFMVNEDRKEERRQLMAEGKAGEAARVGVVPVDFAAEARPLLAARERHREVNRVLATELLALQAAPPTPPVPELRDLLERFGA
jgi:phosphate transport system permease protein